MTFRLKALVCLVIASAVFSLYSSVGHISEQWLHFFVYLAAILLSSGMKVALPKSEGTMSVNFPFILLGILQLSPLQAVALATSSVIAQCRIKVIKPFTLIQILFNVANVTTATVLAWHAYAGSLRHLHQVAPALAAASGAYFLANTIPIALILGFESGTPIFKQWRQDFLWYAPFYLVGAMLAAAADFIGIHFGWLTSLLLIPMVYTVYRAYCAQMAIVRDRERHIVETEALHLRTIEALAMAVEAKDENTHRHLMRVRVYVTELGKALGLDKSMMQALTSAAFLHDIGKLAVPEHIINKPGKLTPEEFEKMKIHPVVGADILERIHFPYPVVPIVRAHHEAWDGSGYPDGLKGEEIPIAARILTAVDCFDALASERPYRRAMPLADAMVFVKKRAGVQFDPEVVRLLEARYLELEELSRQQINLMEPLKTDLFIERGAAPGAGFVPTHAVATADNSDGVSGSANPETLKAERVASIHQIAKASQEAMAIFELSQALGSSIGEGEISAMMSARLQPFIPFDCFAVYLKSKETVVAQHIDGPLARAFTSRPIPLGKGLSGWVAHTERPIVNGNPTVEPNLVSGSGLFSESSSALSIPLLDANGVVFGALTVYSAKPAAYSKDHLRILHAIQSKFSLSLQNAFRFRKTETDTQIDYLTQLPNMRHFFQKVEAEIESARDAEGHFGIVVCDVNTFKTINDRHGQLTGDDLLRAIARKFSECSGPGAIVARIGGDEFGFLIPSMDVLSAERRLEMLEEAVQEACSVLNIEMGLSISSGIAFYPADGETAEELLGRADRGMYLQKRNASGTHGVRKGSAVLEGLTTP
jgi:diguanylate cyclase (GGDEF)-like protein/putative nucleotidyltransferase with HDIG domain